MPNASSSRSVGPDPPTRTTAGSGFAAGVRRLRQRAGEREAVGRDLHLLVVRPRNRHAPRRDRRDVLAHDVEVLRGNRQPQQAAGFIAPHFGVERPRSTSSFSARPPHVDHPRRRLEGSRTRTRRPGSEATPGPRRPTPLRPAPPLQRAAPAPRTAPERARQEHGIGGDRVGFLARLSCLRELRRRGRAVDDRVHRQRLTAQGRLHRQLERFPVGVVAHLNPAGDEINRQPQASRIR